MPSPETVPQLLPERQSGRLCSPSRLVKYRPTYLRTSTATATTATTALAQPKPTAAEQPTIAGQLSVKFESTAARIHSPTTTTSSPATATAFKLHLQQLLFGSLQSLQRQRLFKLLGRRLLRN